MATIKSFTDLEQSKKLAEILPLESADMCYFNSDIDKIIVREWEDEIHDEDDLPCWSLAALLSVLKYPSLTQDVENKWSITDFTGAYPKSEHSFDNPVDACVAMIEKLYKLKML